MSRSTTTYLAVIVGAVCLYFLAYALPFGPTRTVRNDIIQGVLIGFGLAFVVAQAVARMRSRRVNGWTTMVGLGVPDNGMILRAAHAQYFPGPVTVPEEAMYWWANTDGSGRTLDGRHAYVLHFPPGGLPPNDAFWSLTMGDARNHFVPNPIDRYSVSDRTGLVPNGDGSVDVYLQRAAPQGHEANWLPAPAGPFLLWLRVYVPGPSVLDGSYTVPPVVRVAGGAA